MKKWHMLFFSHYFLSWLDKKTCSIEVIYLFLSWWLVNDFLWVECNLLIIHIWEGKWFWIERKEELILLMERHLLKILLIDVSWNQHVLIKCFVQEPSFIKPHSLRLCLDPLFWEYILENAFPLECILENSFSRMYFAEIVFW